MSRVSTFAGSSFSPERMLRSTTAPVSKFLNLVRVNAAPLPGLTNWNSMTLYGFPSIKTLRPLRISDVSYMVRAFTPHVRHLSNQTCDGARRMRRKRVDAAGHYRKLLQLGRDEFLASAAPAVLVRFRRGDADLDEP